MVDSTRVVDWLARSYSITDTPLISLDPPKSSSTRPEPINVGRTLSHRSSVDLSSAPSPSLATPANSVFNIAQSSLLSDDSSTGWAIPSTPESDVGLGLGLKLHVDASSSPEAIATSRFHRELHSLACDSPYTDDDARDDDFGGFQHDIKKYTAKRGRRAGVKNRANLARKDAIRRAEADRAGFNIPDSANLKAFHDFKAGAAGPEQGWVSPTGSLVRLRQTSFTLSTSSPWPALSPKLPSTLDEEDERQAFDDMPRGEGDGLGITLAVAFDPFGPLDAQVHLEANSFAFDECRNVWAPRQDEYKRIHARMIDARATAVSAQKRAPVVRSPRRPVMRRPDFVRGYFSASSRPLYSPPASRYGRFAAAPFRPAQYAMPNAPRPGQDARFAPLLV